MLLTIEWLSAPAMLEGIVTSTFGSLIIALIFFTTAPVWLKRISTRLDVNKFRRGTARIFTFVFVAALFAILFSIPVNMLKFHNELLVDLDVMRKELDEVSSNVRTFSPGDIQTNTQALELNWRDCEGPVWCPLLTVNLKKVSEHGVYIIWGQRGSFRVEHVGQGVIAQELAQHRMNSKFTSRYTADNLFVTWADVPKSQRNGIELYLRAMYSDLGESLPPNTEPIKVNSPWNSAN